MHIANIAQPNCPKCGSWNTETRYNIVDGTLTTTCRICTSGNITNTASVANTSSQYPNDVVKAVAEMASALLEDPNFDGLAIETKRKFYNVWNEILKRALF